MRNMYKIIPVIYPSAGRFWLSSVHSLICYSINNCILTDLPETGEFCYNAKDIRKAAEYLKLPLPLTLYAPEINKKRHNKSSIVYYHKQEFPKNSFVQFKINEYNFFIARPELCFLQAPGFHDFLDCVRFGTDLCAIYKEDASSLFGQANYSPVMSRQSLSEYLQTINNYGYPTRARQAFRYILNHSNSPIETALGIACNLPWNRGGYKAGNLIMNYGIDLEKTAADLLGYNHVRVDLAWSGKRFAVEYNSNLTHLNSWQMAQDYNRLTALHRSKWKTMVLTSANISEFEELEKIMFELRANLNLQKEQELADKYKSLRRAVMTRLFHW